MSDTLTLKRIVDLVTQADIDSSVYTIIDSVTGAVKKYPIGSLICSIAPIFDATAAYAAGKYCNYNGQLYQFDEAHAAGSWTGSDATAVTLSEFLEAIGADVDDLKEALTDVSATIPTKADKSGVVASAEQLLSDVGTEDKQPYLFRATPYDSTRVDEEIVGATVGANQLASQTVSDYQIYASKCTLNFADGVGTITVTSSDLGVKGFQFKNMQLHVYMLSALLKTNNADHRIMMGLYTAQNAGIVTADTTSTTYERKTLLFKPQDATNWMGLRVSNDALVDATGIFEELQLIDLTAWFGSTIADYAYTLEQATAGSGVAWIKALLPGGYIPYSAPKLESVSGLSGHKFTGFNWWDEEWESGSLDQNNGGPLVNADWSRSKNYIKVLPGGTYYFEIEGLSSNNGAYVFYYGADKNFLGYDSLVVSNNRTLNGNVGFIRIQYKRAIAVVADYKVCINLSDPAKNGTYEPYKETTYPLDSDLTLRGILKMDSDHNVYADGDVHGSDGTVTRYYDEVDLGSLTWTMSAQESNVFYVNISGMKPVSNGVVANAKLLPYTYYSTGNGYDTPDKNYHVGGSYYGATHLVIHDSTYSDATAFKTAMDGVKFVYEKATATTETADPYASPQNCAPGGTEEYVYGESGSGVPVGHNSKYLANLKGEIERVMVAVPDAPSANGTYSLKATVSSGTVTYAWVSD